MNNYKVIEGVIKRTTNDLWIDDIIQHGGGIDEANRCMKHKPKWAKAHLKFHKKELTETLALMAQDNDITIDEIKTIMDEET